jgi:ribonucleoside-triphosphate reductase (formate)
VSNNKGAEVLLGDKSFCCLFETVLPRFNGNISRLHRAIYLAGRANYRQTCVNLKDGILSDAWHELNEFLHLCGVGITGYVQWEHCDQAAPLQELRKLATEGANSMADELGITRPKNVTVSKPSGSLGKISDCSEGVHKPLGRYIFNSIGMSKYDPLIDRLREANYKMMENPLDPTSILVTFPVKFDDIDFEVVPHPERGDLEVNRESAVTQLERYKLLMDNYVDQNCSVTISYDQSEVPEIVDWLYANWDSYVGVSFIYRADPTKTAADLGFPYLPQAVVTRAEYEEYAAQLLPLSLDNDNSGCEIQADECAGGMCPVR